MNKLFAPILVVIGLLAAACGKDPYDQYCKNVRSDAQDNADRQALDAYITRNKMKNVKESASGLRYVIKPLNKKEQELDENYGKVRAKATSTINANYKLYRADDEAHRAIDSSAANAQFYLGNVVPAWTEGLQLINKRDTIQLLVPSYLAYGSCGNSGNGYLANTALAFDIVFTELIK